MGGDHTVHATANEANLLLLATEQKVYGYDLSQLTRVTIGRHEANDLQLDSRTVSNYHAEILKKTSGKLLLRDLGSTNGTFINERRVTEQELVSGDRIRVGSHIVTFKVELQNGKADGFFRYKREPDAFAPGTTGRIISMRARSAEAHKTLQARDPHDLSLPDLLKIVTTNSVPVVISVRRGNDGDNDVGRISIHKQRIVHAEYRRAMGEKALYRLFGWQEAAYEIAELSNPSSVPRTVVLPTDHVILEGMRQASELGKLIAQLPPMEVPLTLKEDCPLPLTAHTPAEIEIFQDIIRHETIAVVLEQSPLTDLRILKLIDSLVRKGVFEISTRNTNMEETFVYRASKTSSEDS